MSHSNITMPSASALPPSLPMAAVRRRFADCVASLGVMVRAIQTRRQLAGMDGHMLSDIGISRAEAEHEAARAPWDLAPPAWYGRR
jgi:uncharacterized protein YjiS (DUF1127 family)